MRKQATHFFVLLALALTGFVVYSCGTSQPTTSKEDLEAEAEANKPLTPEEIEEEKFYATYNDSLRKYFSPLEIDMIKQYRRNHNKLETEEDFRTFFRNATTLKTSLSKTIQKSIDYYYQQGGKTLPNLHWFDYISDGLNLAEVGMEKPSYDLFYDYGRLVEFANKTSGKADDEFMKLLRMCYEDSSYRQNWVKPANTKMLCSKLGGGTHYEILRQADLAEAQGDLFSKEIQMLRIQIMNDILHWNYYCHDKKEVVESINKILTDIKLSEQDKQYLKLRIQQFEEPEKNQVHLGCNKGTC